MGMDGSGLLCVLGKGMDCRLQLNDVLLGRCAT